MPGATRVDAGRDDILRGPLLLSVEAPGHESVGGEPSDTEGAGTGGPLPPTSRVLLAPDAEANPPTPRSGAPSRYDERKGLLDEAQRWLDHDNAAEAYLKVKEVIRRLRLDESMAADEEARLLDQMRPIVRALEATRFRVSDHDPWSAVGGHFFDEELAQVLALLSDRKGLRLRQALGSRPVLELRRTLDGQGLWVDGEPTRRAGSGGLNDVFLHEGTQTAYRLFRDRDTRAVDRLAHFNLVAADGWGPRVRDIGQMYEGPYIAVDAVSGVSLDHLDWETLSAQQRQAILEQVAEMLIQLCDAGVHVSDNITPAQFMWGRLPGETRDRVLLVDADRAYKTFQPSTHMAERYRDKLGRAPLSYEGPLWDALDPARIITTRLSQYIETVSLQERLQAQSQARRMP